MFTKLNPKQHKNKLLLSSGFSPVSHDVGQIIAENAYYKAQKRGFEPGFEVHDWMESEREVLTLTARLWSF